ncbi:hypothetical protein ORI89_18725 [Sphingobacterium sp. UT-1RO-CII-1]|uniref:hypothetical protein n=1 Tax=Sphingobacterium sp. UT-1RO-CII-1 TaxID=2995225 RepID=UPI00227A0007|nr:hypothetical protein [Sphingobacterium sp. UT-1RO-CII-1]MCY4781692.1 hypothetical protein [Sphingobacterium sp. UT-1RO-CII-1]
MEMTEKEKQNLARKEWAILNKSVLIGWSIIYLITYAICAYLFEDINFMDWSEERKEKASATFFVLNFTLIVSYMISVAPCGIGISQIEEQGCKEKEQKQDKP